MAPFTQRTQRYAESRREKFNFMRYLGEYVIPIAALILALGVFYWREFAIAAVLIKRLIKRMLA
jgi:hypothetical protein